MSEPVGMVPGATTQEPNGQPHDALFRLVFGDPDNAASELRSVLPPRLTARINLDNLRPQPGTFVDPELQHRHIDLLFRTTTDNGDAYLYLLVEHQRTSDPAMALRMMTYQTRIWEHHRITEGTAASAPLPLIIPIVIYQGHRHWTAATDIADLIDNDLKADAGDLLPHVRYLVDDLTLLDDAALRARPLTSAARITFVVFARAPGDDDVTTWLDQWFDDFIRLTALWNHERLLKGIFTYLLKTSTTPEEHLIRFAGTLGPTAQEAAVTTAEQLHDRGYATGQSSLLTNMLAVKFGALDNDTHDRVAHATQEQITLWSSRLVQGAETLDDVFRS
ncbi:Rpn family recombination-promoting nuclease/putative transposase [uncultured Gordonia sp.]|uniref:Rpn family recombination-promoting nuclease/putative transposase n=1 Tax=uncultured Gordonia sp. TaxID=198437 RepID=UPI00261E15A3|nr:Rpn family recombination-promoting nuclease/putative transposase [uncultured Gordonia sp.]